VDEFFVCPNCQMPVKRGAAACPHCGADEQAGWSDAATLDLLDVPRPLSDEEYDELRESMLQHEHRRRPKWWLVITSSIIIVMFILWGTRC